MEEILISALHEFLEILILEIRKTREFQSVVRIINPLIIIFYSIVYNEE